jgi:hypothetical protein
MRAGSCDPAKTNSFLRVVPSEDDARIGRMSGGGVRGDVCMCV